MDARRHSLFEFADFTNAHMNRWKHEIEGSKVGNSRILACPDILRDCWLDELEYDAFLSLPGDSEQEKLRGIANWCLCYMVLIR